MDKQNLNLKKRRCEKEMPVPVRTIAQEEDEDEEIMLPGFRFHPTDEELLTFYLRRKVDRKRLSIEIIKEVDIYRFDPWDLPRTNGGGENEWYYFCLRGRKYRNSSRPNRVTSSGFWKATGIDRPIYAPTGTVAGTTEGVCIGLKKSLVYYKGSAGKGTKTDWMMHEYRLPLDSGNDDSTPPSMQEAEVWTICRIFKRGNKYKRDPRNCREATSKKTQTDQYSSSNTSSLEFDGGDLYQIDNGDASNYVNSQYGVVEHPVSNYNYIDQTNQMNQGRWMNPTVQNPAPVFHPNDLNPVVNEWNHKDGNWDELGIMMEYIDQGMFQDYV